MWHTAGLAAALVAGLATLTPAAPPQLTIYHFDVNAGDATLLLTPDRRAVLIDGGDKGRGKNPIAEFLNRNHGQGLLAGLDYVILTHYDTDHASGLVDLFEAGWYPEIAMLDRGDTLLPPLDSAGIADQLDDVDWDRVRSVARWGGAPASYCDRNASARLVEYFLAAEARGRHRAIVPGDTLLLDHDIRIICLAANGRSLNGRSADVNIPRDNKDCAVNDLSVALLVEYGDFRYLCAGDLTGVPSEHVADVEETIKDFVHDIDVYHVNHHGSEASSSDDFIQVLHPAVAVVSNGTKYNHPRATVIEGRLLALDPAPVVYCTNRPAQDGAAWQAPDDAIADLDNDDYDGMVEITIWTRTYRVNLWRNGERVSRSDPFDIKERL